MTGARHRSRCIGLAVALLLVSASAGWPQSPSATSGQPSKQLLDYAEVAKADIAVARVYLEAAAAEMAGLATRFETYRGQAKQFRDTFDRDFAEAKELRRPRGFAAFPQWNNHNATTMPGGGVNAFKLPADPSLASLDGRLARLDSIPATAAKMKRAFSENDARVEIDNAEREISNAIHGAIGRLWGMYLWEARWQYHLLSLEYSRKIWNVEKSYAGEMNAAGDALVAELDLVDARCRALLNDQRNHSNAEYLAVCRQPGNAANEEYSRRIRGVCERANDEAAPYVAEIAARLQAVADHLKETHSRVVEDFRRVVDRIEQDKSGIKVDAFARVNDFLKKSKIIDTDGPFVRLYPTDFAVLLYRPFGNAIGGPDEPQCSDWSAQMPADLATRYPAVRIEFEPVSFYVAFNQSGVVQGEAEARAADARP